MIGFVVAMQKEASLLLDTAEIKKEYTIAGKTIYEGTVWGKDFALILAGIGKVNAAMSTQILIDKYTHLKQLINFGLAGGKNGSGLHAGDIVCVKECCQYDFDLSELDPVNIGYMQDYNLTYYPLETTSLFPAVRCATADRFTSKKLYLDIISDLKGDISDMECGAIAQVCLANKMPLISIKLISDVDGDSSSIFEQYCNNASDVCSKIPDALKQII